MNFADLDTEISLTILRERAEKYNKKCMGVRSLFSKTDPEEESYWKHEVFPFFPIDISYQMLSEHGQYDDIKHVYKFAKYVAKFCKNIAMCDGVHIDNMLNECRSHGRTNEGLYWYSTLPHTQLLPLAVASEDVRDLYEQFLYADLEYLSKNSFGGKDSDRFSILYDSIAKIDNRIDFFSQNDPKHDSSHPVYKWRKDIINCLVAYAISDDFIPFFRAESDGLSNGEIRYQLAMLAYRDGDERITDRYDYLFLNQPEMVAPSEYESLTDGNNYWYGMLLNMLNNTENEEVLSHFVGNPIFNGVVYTLMMHDQTKHLYGEGEFEQALEDAWNTHVQLEALFNILGNHPLIKPKRLQIKERLGTLAHHQTLENEAQATRVAQERQTQHAADQAYYAQQQAVAAEKTRAAQVVAANAANRQANESAKIRKKLERY